MHKRWIQWVAFRFWKSKKSFSIVNIISSISFWGIAVGTAALIIVLSAFNGLEGLISSMFNNFHSDLRIEPVSGKFFENKEIDTSKIIFINGVENVSFILEDICMVRYADRQQIAFIKGVEPNKGFEQRFGSFLLEGGSNLGSDSFPQVIVGASLFYSLGININDYFTPIAFYAPKRDASTSLDISSAFISENAAPIGMFSVQQDFDERYIIAPMSLARNLFLRQQSSSAIEISISNPQNIKQIESKIQDIVGKKFIVKNKIEQEEALYKIMKGEKLVVFLILSLILLITSFTIISTLTLEIISKRKDLSTLYSLGASVSQVRQIIVSHGFIISITGMLLGFLLSTCIIFLQQKLGLVRLGGGETFVTNIYPIKIILTDYLYVFLTVIMITALVSQIPIRRINKNWFSFRY